MATSTAVDSQDGSHKPEKRGRQLVNRENRSTVGEALVDNPRMVCRNVNVYYGDKHAIHEQTYCAILR